MCSIIQNRIFLGGIILFNHFFIKENSLETKIEKVCPQMSEVHGWFESCLSGFRALLFLLVSLLFISADCPMFSFTLNCDICYLSEDVRGLALFSHGVTSQEHSQKYYVKLLLPPPPHLYIKQVNLGRT